MPATAKLVDTKASGDCHPVGIKTVKAGAADLRRVALDVLCNDVIVLKGAVDPELVRVARDAVHAWGLTTPQCKEHPRANGGATHMTSYLPAKSQSRYIAHDFLFDPRSAAPIAAKVLPVFEALRLIYCGLLDDDIGLRENRDGVAFLPQIIQYPRGGGFFQEHFHPIRPQKIGLVLAGSHYGTDYNVGGGRFRAADGTWVTTEGVQDIGDVALFRFDIGHDITPVDPDRALDWSRPDGRWSFVLPLKPEFKSMAARVG